MPRVSASTRGKHSSFQPLNSRSFQYHQDVGEACGAHRPRGGLGDLGGERLRSCRHHAGNVIGTQSGGIDEVCAQDDVDLLRAMLLVLLQPVQVGGGRGAAKEAVRRRGGGEFEREVSKRLAYRSRLKPKRRDDPAYRAGPSM